MTEWLNNEKTLCLGFDYWEFSPAKLPRQWLVYEDPKLQSPGSQTLLTGQAVRWQCWDSYDILIKVNILFPGQVFDHLASWPMFQSPMFWNHDTSANEHRIFESLTRACGWIAGFSFTPCVQTFALNMMLYFSLWLILNVMNFINHEVINSSSMLRDFKSNLADQIAKVTEATEQFFGSFVLICVLPWWCQLCFFPSFHLVIYSIIQTKMKFSSNFWIVFDVPFICFRFKGISKSPYFVWQWFSKCKEAGGLRGRLWKVWWG